MQVLAGDVDLAEEAFGAFFGLWQRFGLLPERFTLDMGGTIHPTEQYYPLRPELLESAFYLHEVRVYCIDPLTAHSKGLLGSALPPGRCHTCRPVWPHHSTAQSCWCLRWGVYGVRNQIRTQAVRAKDALQTVHGLDMQATGKDMYREAVSVMLDSLNRHTRVLGGFASIRSVLSMEQVSNTTPTAALCIATLLMQPSKLENAFLNARNRDAQHPGQRLQRFRQ